MAVPTTTRVIRQATTEHTVTIRCQRPVTARVAERSTSRVTRVMPEAQSSWKKPDRAYSA